MQGVGFQSFTGVALGDDIERAGPGHVNRKGDEQNHNGSDARLDMDRMEKETVEGLINDVDGGENEQSGLNKRGKIFKLAVAVGVALIRRLVGDAHGEKRDHGGDKVEA